MNTVCLFLLLALKVLEHTCNGLKQETKPSDYLFTLERVQCPWYNRSILDNFEAKSHRYNRTSTVFNLVLDFVTDIRQLKTIIKFYKSDLTQYKLTAIQYSINACQYMKLNLIGMGALKTKGNLTDCPMKKGLYVVKNMAIGGADFPPNFPASRWKIDVRVLVNKAYAFDLEIYCNLEHTT